MISFTQSFRRDVHAAGYTSIGVREAAIMRKSWSVRRLLMEIVEAENDKFVLGHMSLFGDVLQQ
jgi:hypothetical protein